MFNIDPDLVPKLKLGLHGLQIALSFVIWVMEIVVFRNEKATINGNNGWTFGVCFLSIPAWIYLIMCPRWDRSRRLAEPRVMLGVDAIFTIFWLSAFASQAKFNSDGKCGDVCGISKAIVGLGVVVTLLFAGTTFVSAFTLKYQQWHGMLPGYEKTKLSGGGPANFDPDKTAFSMAPDGDEPYARVDMDDPEYHSTTVPGGHRRTPSGYNDDDTGYEPSRYTSTAIDDDINSHRHSPSLSANPYSGGGGTYNSRHSMRYDNSPRMPEEPSFGSRVGSPNPAMQYANPPRSDSGYDRNPPARFPDANYGAL